MNTFDFLQSMLDDAVGDGCFPSACCAVGVRDRPPQCFAAGDAYLTTRFDMASLSKLLAPTMLALLAVERGDLCLDDEVGRFFPGAPADKRGITIFQLMTHTGGFEPWFLLQDEISDPADAAACILRHPLAAAPDGTPRYSCMGYILLGKILEAVYNEPLDRLAEERVFRPLGMNNTGYRPRGGDIAPTEVDSESGVAWRGVVHDENARFLEGVDMGAQRPSFTVFVAPSYVASPRNTASIPSGKLLGRHKNPEKSEHFDSCPHPLGGVSGNAGVFSDIADMVKFARMLATGGGKLLSPATLAMAVTNHTPGRGERRGLGFQLGGTPRGFMGDLFPPGSFGHTGFTGTSLAVDPSTGLFAILLTNRVHPSRDNDRLLRFRRVFHNRVYAAFSKMLTN